MKGNNYSGGLGIALLAIVAIIHTADAYADEITGEFLVFPHLGVIFHPDLAPALVMDDHDYKYGADLFATFESGNFLFLGEALLVSEEQEIERLQLGWRWGDTNIWLGRFHNPVGYWNTQFHHGSYLETSISRPAVVEFEDHDGILPVHLTGLLIEGLFERDQHGWGYDLAVAAGPELSDKLEAVEVLNPGAANHDLIITLNLHYEPVPYAPTRYGVFVNYTELPAAIGGLQEVRQTSAGVYGNWESGSWRLLGSMFYIHNSLRQLNLTTDEGLFSGYVQAEYNLHKQWTLFGRGEWTLGAADDVYPALFPQHVRDRLLAGIRLDFLDRHALKLELSGNDSIAGDFTQVILQWDAMF